MASAHEIAEQVLEAFGVNVVSRRSPRTYGEYAAAIGRDPKEYGLAVGKAMHAIGAVCVIRQLPVAPLYWVRSESKERRRIFESDVRERKVIVESNDIELMYVVAREYHYTSEEFAGLKAALAKSLSSGRIAQWSPHEIWHLAFDKSPAGSAHTYYERAMSRYRELFEAIKRSKSERGQN